MKKTPFIFSVLLVTCLFFQSSHAATVHDMSLKWQTLQSKNFDIHFHDGEDALARKTANIAEHLLIDLQKELNWKVNDIIEIVLSDEQDYANGFASAMIQLRITLLATTPDESFSFDNWLALLIRHELTHLLHIDKVSGTPRFLRKIFGKHPLLGPNLFQPLWLIEGYATYQETNKKKHTGRGSNSIFHMLMRNEVKNGIKPLTQVNMDISTWPARKTRYLYGYYFYEFIAATYGKAAIAQFITGYSDNLVPYRLNNNARSTLGKPFEALWREFSTYLNQKFQDEIREINTTPLMIGDKITNTGFNKLFSQPLKNGNLLYAEDNATQPAQLLLKKFNIDKTEFISEVQPESYLDYHPDSGVLLSQIEIYRNTNAFYDLFHIDLNSQEETRLTRGDRFRKATWNPDGTKILAIYNKLGHHSLVLLNKEGKLIDLLWEGESGEYISGIDWSPDNSRIIASIKRNHNHWNLEAFDVAQREWQSITLNSANEIQPQFSDDGKYIFYSADYNGVYNIHKLNIETSKISTLSHVEGGAFSPKPDVNGGIYYTGYNAKGYDIYHLTAEHLETSKTLPLPQLPLTSKAIAYESSPYKDVEFEIKDYAMTAHLSPTWWTPTLSGSLESIQLGALTSGSDALNRHSYGAYLNFDTQSTALSGAINYRYDRWFPLLQTHLGSTGRDTYRTNSYQFEILAPLLSRNRKFYLGTSFLYEREKLTERKSDGSETTLNNIDPLIGLGIIYDSRRRMINSISQSHGRLLSLIAESSDVFGGNINGKMFTVKWQEYISLRSQQVLALQAIGGFGLQDPRPFRLGGSISDASNESLIPTMITLYNKRRYALRGYPSDAESLIGKRMLMYSIEWRAPLKTIERSLGMLPIGLHKLSSALFAEGASVWSDGTSPRNKHYSVGGELSLHTELLFVIPSQIRLGYAYGMHADGEHQVYFGLNSSF